MVIFNHNFEKNIPVIRRIYARRFSQVVQLMPFYSGNDPDVIRVFGNSFQFHAYIAQARRFLHAIPCDRYLFIGDDLVLNPELNEGSLAALMKLDGHTCFHPGMHDVSRGEFYRGTMEAHNFGVPPPGLDPSALQGIPTYDEAFSILHRKGLMATTRLRRVKPYLPLFEKPWRQHGYENYKILRARLWHLRNSLKYWFENRVAAYPVVFGYSDIFSIPRVYFDEYCDFLEVFASIGMFVELAIPTAFALHDWPMVCENDLALSPLNLWFPQDPRLFKEKAAKIEEVSTAANYQINNLHQAFPGNHLYIHPFKLSKWT